MADDVYRAKQGLRGGWHAVLLDKKLIDNLHNCGIPYDQDQVRARPGRDVDLGE